ncbi:replication-relaxation family protein [Microbacterium sp. JAI119]|uniref:replication-relaxation family protein n=1 Tax=Microbacterium sp. JAI119 TaxID=2723062 RepID=UPI0015CD1E62|nr:replication-relaxation family protein [Microbacterium sp. JAI119]NYF28062.1 hypothetical protein [Microbacterium sp. JAI119]
MSDRWTPYKIEQLEAKLTVRDAQVLGSLEQFRALTTRLIQRLHFPAGPHGLHRTQQTATRLCNRVLLRLEADGFIARIEGRSVGGATRGSAGTTWHLGATGERLLRARRGDPSRRRYVIPSRPFLAHTLDVASFAAQLRECETTGTLDVLELTTEPSCWRAFQTTSGNTMLKPDLAVVVANAELEAHVFVEIDRGTEHLPAVIKKCRTYQFYRQTGIEQHQSGVFPAVLWVVPDHDRARKLHTAISREKELPGALFTIAEASNAMQAVSGFLTSSDT